MWATKGVPPIRGLFEKKKNNLVRFGVLLFLFRKKRKFSRCKGPTQYIITDNCSLYMGTGLANVGKNMDSMNAFETHP